MTYNSRLLLGATLLLPDLGLLALAAMIAVPPRIPTPPEAASGNSVRKRDFGHMPPLRRYTARGGSQLAYRLYPAGTERVAVLIHGASGDSTAMHPLAKTLSGDGTTAYALDMRGHGESGRPGDIDYVGQLDDDVADLVPVIRSRCPKARLTLVGFSAGGGFALRFAAGPYGALFDRYVLLSPYLGNDPGILRPGAAQWAERDTPRIMGISFLDRLGIHWFDRLPAVSYAIPLDLSDAPTETYSLRLAENFSADADYLGDFTRARSSIAVVAGESDEFFYTDRFPALLKAARPDVSVSILPGFGHMDLISDPRALRKVEARIAAAP